MDATISATARQQQVLLDVAGERDFQDRKWGPQDHTPLEWLSILGEEYGEACQAANKAYWGGKPWAAYRAELVQVAAVAVAMIENLDQREQESRPYPAGGYYAQEGQA
jgi:NTP pyrophosphatase (non-canonical NTP hydrolase)